KWQVKHINLVYILIFSIQLADERLSDIKPQFEASLDVFYLSAQRQPHQQVAFIPLPHSKSIDFQLLQALQRKLVDSSIHLAIADNTGNILYYQIQQGIGEKL
ncbi:hypothetical protein KR222_005319, partial [Zaprionus bogoriensis]